MNRMLPKKLKEGERMRRFLKNKGKAGYIVGVGMEKIESDGEKENEQKSAGESAGRRENECAQAREREREETWRGSGKKRQ